MRIFGMRAGWIISGLAAVVIFVVAYAATSSGALSTLFHPPALTEETADIHVAIWTMLLALSTVLLFVATFALFYVTLATLRHTREITILQMRPVISAEGVKGLYGKEGTTTRYWWKVAPVWVNSGTTSTRETRTSVSALVVDRQPLPIDHKFNFEETPAAARGNFSAKQSLTGGMGVPAAGMGLSPEDVAAMIVGTKFLYLWGWVRYRDGFEGTPERVTQFAWLVRPEGNPFEFDPAIDPAGVRFTFYQMQNGNLAT